jgi:6-phosphogluconolactonase (cycloisomerase 2 family)
MSAVVREAVRSGWRALIWAALSTTLAAAPVQSTAASDESAAAVTDLVACVSETGTSGVCADGIALEGATGVSVSPDGASVYVASETSRAVSVFARDASNGAVAQLGGMKGCISASGSGGACAKGIGVVGPRAVAVSPDGRNFYFPASHSAAVAVFARERTTGTLTQLPGRAGCVSETGTGGACDDGDALEGARAVAISPDGASVYIASFFSDAIATFARNSTTGALTQLGGIRGCVSESANGVTCRDGVALDGVRGVVVSPDGRNVYAASEFSSAVAVFKRDVATGVLKQLSGRAACVSQSGSGGACLDGRALRGAADVTVSADGRSAYVASLAGDAVSVFSRDRATGELSQIARRAGCVSETGNGGSCVDGKALDRARSLVVSNDDANVYVAAERSDAVSVFARDAATGALRQLAGKNGCVSETASGGACTQNLALDGVRSVRVSPDGENVYTASFLSSALSVFSRDPVTGALKQSATSQARR